MYDVIIIGGSYAGLSAAIYLGRARKNVLVLDSGKRRNRFASHAHGFLGQDGVPPETIAALGRGEALAYPTIAMRQVEVSATRAEDGAFSVTDAEEVYRAKRLILATGIGDELPPIPGLAERWGQFVFHCPYCHGYELNRGRLGVLATNELAMHSASLVAEWAGKDQMTLFLNGAFEPDDKQLEELKRRGIKLERSAVLRAEKGIELVLADGRTVELDGLFVLPRTVIKAPFAEQLGCALDVGPLGPFIKTDFTKETTVPGVFACGDVALAMGSVAFAVADGAMAGTGAHRSLVFQTG
jgi:thioredoxin reductase